MKGFVVAGERSGVGKTMLTLTLADACMRRGLKVQCFKVGPDFIDPGYHTVITGRVSRNLDGWMMGRHYCLESFEKHACDADIVLVEGVMGLFDGCGGTGDDGSTAQIARWLGLPVVLVVDGSSFARSAGALVLGFEQYDRRVRVAGVLFNKVAGQRHYDYLSQGVTGRCRGDVLGYVARGSAWHIPERHLGLTMAHEHDALRETVGRLSRRLTKTVRLDTLLSYERRNAGPGGSVPAGKSRAPVFPPVSVAVARDEAFCFYYEDNIDLLRQCGARIRYFSPMRDRNLPEHIDGLYLGGGYPELYAAALSRNETMRRDVAAFCARGRPVYAECGGFLYLLRAMRDQDGTRHDMVGVFPAEATMRSRRQRLGYVEGQARENCPFLEAGARFRGHEFHYSDISPMPADIARCYRIAGGGERGPFDEGYRAGNVLASYVHLHFASNPAFARNFVMQCASGTED